MATKSVRFSSDSKQAPPPESKSSASVVKPSLQMVNSTRIKVGGKAHPRRDLAIMISVIALMIYWTKDFDGPTTAPILDEPKENRIASALNSIAESLSKRVVEGQRDQRQDPCGVYLASGSIPGTGDSFFAGKEYNVGDLLLETSLSYGISLDDQTCVTLPSYSFVLKHHPYLHNVESVTITDADSRDDGLQSTHYQLRAAKPISAGDELFLAVEKHPSSHVDPSVTHRMFDHIPTGEEYDLATEIIAQGIQTANQISWAQSRKQVKVNPDHVYSLLRRTISKVNKRVGALLPLQKRQADMHRDGTPSHFASLRNRTLANLQRYGTCTNDLHFADPRESSVVLQRQETKKGTALLRIPVLILPRDSSESMCVAQEGYCVQRPDLPFVICPLVDVASIPYGPEGNAELKWAEKDMLKRQKDQILSTHGLAMALEITALKTLKAGDTIKLRGDSPFGWRDELMAHHWQL